MSASPLNSKCRRQTEAAPASGPRTEATPSKIRAFKPDQRAALRRWLQDDKNTYAATQAKLKKEFGISLSISAISRFWHRHCAPPLVAPDILLDVIIQSYAPVRLIIKKKAKGVVCIAKPAASPLAQPAQGPANSPG
jgi:hypothetical protein